VNQRLDKLVSPNDCEGHQAPKYKKWFKIISLLGANTALPPALVVIGSTNTPSYLSYFLGGRKLGLRFQDLGILT
jgi:hypothetical protein